MKIFKKNVSKITVLLLTTLGLLGTYSFVYDDYRCIAYVHNKMTQPLLSLQDLLVSKVQSGFAYVQNQQILLEQLAAQEQSCLDLQARLIALEAEKLFIEDVLELVEYRKNYGAADAKLVRILLKNIDACQHFCYIDGGADKNIIVDSAVVYKNSLVGRVTQVYPTYSKVMLITDQNCKVAVVCAHTKTTGIYSGTCAQDAGALQYVSHMHQLEVGDDLLCAGEGLIYPYGFCVGTIDSFEQNSIEYKVLVKPLLNLAEIKFCYVLSPRNGSVTESTSGA